MALTGIALLRSKVAIGAPHNSCERFDAPKCHEGTRSKILSDLMERLGDIQDPKHILWVNGSAGAGKSAIAQALATILYEEGRLSGSFFISRTAPRECGRSDEKQLVATLVFQMTMNIPHLQYLIIAALERNPFIFDLEIGEQVEQLIVKPLSMLSEETDAKMSSMVFIIDGLDECLNLRAQSRIVEVFGSAIARMQHKLPHKILIASRTEPIIRSAFMASKISPLLCAISLNDDYYKPDDDIRVFLTESLVESRRVHPSPTIFPVIWPDPKDIERIVVRASRQFIYASTAQKYILAPGANPIKRLRIIAGLEKDPTQSAYQELDALYSHLFEQVKDLPTVLNVLCMLHAFFGLRRNIVNQLEFFLDLPSGGAQLALQDLSSVMKVDNNSIIIVHASFTEYLVEENRSGPFFIFSDAVQVGLFQRCLDHIWKGNRTITFGGGDNYLALLAAHFARRTKAMRPEIDQIISCFDIDLLLDDAPHSPKLGRDIEEYVGWIFDEQKERDSHSPNSEPLTHFTQLKEWISIRLQRFQFNLSNTDTRKADDYYRRVFLCKDPDMHIINAWMRGYATKAIFEDAKFFGPNALTSEKKAQLLYQWCYFALENNGHLAEVEIQMLGCWGNVFVPYNPPCAYWFTYNYLQKTLDVDPANFIASQEIDRDMVGHKLQPFFPDIPQYILNTMIDFMRKYKRVNPESTLKR